MEMLTVEGLSFDYGTRPVLREIEFSVAPGTLCGLLGPNGSGKSTLFKCINGLLKPGQGRVRIGSQNIAHLSRHAIDGIMAVVPQQTTVAFAFSALQMVLMGRTSRLNAMGRPSKADVRDAAGVLADLGAFHLENRPFNALSGGERQIVLLDEPTAHLDFKNQYRIMDLVRDLTRRHQLTTLVTLHDPNLAGRYCSRLVMLKQGLIQREGRTVDVFEESTIEALYEMKVSIQNAHRGRWFVMPGMEQASPSDIVGQCHAVQ